LSSNCNCGLGFTMCLTNLEFVVGRTYWTVRVYRVPL